jgi:hypothetical protein
LTKRKSKAGKEFLELSIKKENGYEKYLCFESTKIDNYNNPMYSIIVKEDNQVSNNLPNKESTDLPF